MKINKRLKRIVTLSLITGSIMYVTGLVPFEKTLIEKSYQDMSLTELQKKVETLSQNGDLPFNMGMELVGRWTQ